MYKLLLVDDEDIIRNGLEKFVDWNSIGVNIVASLADGKDAIAYINENPVDIVLTDIKMTFVSGLELAKYISENKPEIKVVILSAYNDFNFAVEAMKYGVEDYILKTAVSKEIESSISKVLEKISREREQDRIKNIHREWTAEVIPYLKEQLLTDLVTGALQDNQQISRRARLAGADIDLETTKAELYELQFEGLEEYLKSGWKYGKDGFFNALRNFFDTQSTRGKSFFLYSMGLPMRLLALLPDNEKMLGFEDAFFDLFQTKMHLKHVRSFNNIFDVPKEVPFFGNSDKDKLYINNIQKLREQQKNLISLINSGDLQFASNVFNIIVGQMGQLKPEEACKFMALLIVEMQAKLSEISPITRFEKVDFTTYDLERFRQYGLKILEEIEKKISSSGYSSRNYLIISALQYIDKNICNDITLEDAADSVYLSPAYFSRLFKEKVGMSFKDYVVKGKMEKAAELLKQPKYKIYEVASIVGYKCVRFFTKTFKEYSGYTPSEFRAGIHKKGGVSN